MAVDSTSTASAPTPEAFSYLCTSTEFPANVSVTKQRRKYSTERHVFVIDHRYVAKRYRAYGWGRWWSPYWKREHDALTRLQGLPVPATYGYTRVRHGRNRDVLYVRECVQGEPLQKTMPILNHEVLPEVARLVAEVHKRLVIANDYALHNLYRGADGRIYFIDFHRARSFSRRSLSYWSYVGKDLCHLYKVSCWRDSALFHKFLDLYFAQAGTAQGWQRRFVLRACRFWCRTYRVPLPAAYRIGDPS
jgi:RIO-like serine/threonine protein kinase